MQIAGSAALVTGANRGLGNALVALAGLLIRLAPNGRTIADAVMRDVCADSHALGRLNPSRRAASCTP